MAKTTLLGEPSRVSEGITLANRSESKENHTDGFTSR